MADESTECAGCLEIADYLVAQRKARGAHRLALHCDACGATLMAGKPKRPPRPRAGPNPERDLECLAKFAPLLEGSAQDIVPSFRNPYIAPTNQSNGRPDQIDECSQEVRRAITAMHRLEALFDVPDGRRHVLVICYLYYWNGAEARKQWAASDGLETRLGLVFASPEKRNAWIRHTPSKAMRKVGPAEYGRSLIQPAVDAYAATGDVSGENAQRTGRLSISTLNDALSRFAVAVQEEIEQYRLDRERERCARKKAA